MRRQLTTAAALTAVVAFAAPGAAQAATLTDPAVQPAETMSATSSESAPSCAAGTVTTTWETTVVSSAWDAAAGRWVENAPETTSSTSERALTAAEQDACADTVATGVLGEPPVAVEDVPVAAAAVATRTYTAQVNTYSWKGSAWFGTKIASFDNDGVLRYREDGFLWMAPAAKRYTSFAHSFVTFRAPANATKAQLVAAYNAAAPAAKRVATTKTLGAVRSTGTVTDVWVLGQGATASAPWGASKTVNPSFIGRR